MIPGIKLLIEQKMYLQLMNKDMSTLYLTLLISLKLPETTWPILAQDQTQEDCVFIFTPRIICILFATNYTLKIIFKEDAFVHIES